nr:translation initiation factor 1A [Oceanusvirus sp.]
MPKARGPGGKNRKKAKGLSLDSKRELIFAEDGQLYAYVADALGDGRYRLVCNDGESRTGILRGKLWKRTWIRRNDIVLVTLRDYQDDKADIVHKYQSDEIHRLISLQEIDKIVHRHYTSGEYEDGAAVEGDDEDILIFDEDALVDAI